MTCCWTGCETVMGMALSCLLDDPPCFFSWAKLIGVFMGVTAAPRASGKGGIRLALGTQYDSLGLGRNLGNRDHMERSSSSFLCFSNCCLCCCRLTSCCCCCCISNAMQSNSMLAAIFSRYPTHALLHSEKHALSWISKNSLTGFVFAIGSCFFQLG